MGKILKSMRTNFFIAIAAIACESNAVRLQTQGFFDNIVQGVQAAGALTGIDVVANVTNGLGNAATMINSGNIGAGMTGALGSIGGVIPGQAGTVIMTFQLI